MTPLSKDSLRLITLSWDEPKVISGNPYDTPDISLILRKRHEDIGTQKVIAPDTFRTSSSQTQHIIQFLFCTLFHFMNESSSPKLHVSRPHLFDCKCLKFKICRCSTATSKEPSFVLSPEFGGVTDPIWIFSHRDRHLKVWVSMALAPSTVRCVGCPTHP
jgi:hypothetical protein